MSWAKSLKRWRRMSLRTRRLAGVLTTLAALVILGCAGPTEPAEPCPVQYVGDFNGDGGAVYVGGCVRKQPGRLP